MKWSKFCFWLEERGVQAIGIDIVPDVVKMAVNYAKEAGLHST